MKMWPMTRSRMTPLALTLVFTISATAAEVTTDGGLKVESDDGNFSVEIGGRIQIDAAAYDDDITPLDNGGELRRGQLFIKGLLYSDWEYKLETDFSGNTLDVLDAYVKHKPTGFMFGQFKVPFTLEQFTSDIFIVFMERGIEGFAEGRRLGIGWWGNGDRWTIGTNIYGQAIGEDTEGDQGIGFAIRGVYRPWQTADGNLLHLGVSTFFQEPSDETNTSRLRQRPWSHVTDVRFVDTGVIDNVDKERGVNADFLFVSDSYSVQAEYIGIDIERLSGFSDEDFNAWYVYGSWMSNGSKRSYNKARAARGRGKIKKGTWELGLRYSVFDLQSTSIRGGKQDDWTVGVNYYVNPKLRFMGNYVAVDTEDSEITLDGEHESIGVVQFRMNVDF